MAAETLSPMQAEMLARADSIMGAIAATVTKAGDIVAGQVPDIALQFVLYGRVFNTALLLIAIGLTALGYWWAKAYGYQNRQKARIRTDGEWAGSRITAVIAGGIIAFVGAMMVLANVKDFVLVWFAPKIWILMELTALIKG